MAVQQAAPTDCPSENGGIILRPAPTDEPPAEDPGAASALGEDTAGGTAGALGSVAAPNRIDSGGGFLADSRPTSPWLALAILLTAGLALLALRRGHRRKA